MKYFCADENSVDFSLAHISVRRVRYFWLGARKEKNKREDEMIGVEIFEIYGRQGSKVQESCTFTGKVTPLSVRGLCWWTRVEKKPMDPSLAYCIRVDLQK